MPLLRYASTCASTDCQTGLFEFADIYNQYESLTVEYSKVNTAISVLEELRQWARAIARVETALFGGELEIARRELENADDLFHKFERRTQLIGVLQKMDLRSQSLSAEIRKSFTRLWDEMVSMQQNEEATVLTITEDMNGMIFMDCLQ